MNCGGSKACAGAVLASNAQHVSVSAGMEASCSWCHKIRLQLYCAVFTIVHRMVCQGRAQLQVLLLTVLTMLPLQCWCFVLLVYTVVTSPVVLLLWCCCAGVLGLMPALMTGMASMTMQVRMRQHSSVLWPHVSAATDHTGRCGLWQGLLLICITVGLNNRLGELATRPAP